MPETSEQIATADGSLLATESSSTSSMPFASQDATDEISETGHEVPVALKNFHRCSATSSPALPSTQPPKRYRAHADEADPYLGIGVVPGTGRPAS
jgi:hypothetical protein